MVAAAAGVDRLCAGRRGGDPGVLVSGGAGAADLGQARALRADAGAVERPHHLRPLCRGGGGADVAAALFGSQPIARPTD